MMMIPIIYIGPMFNLGLLCRLDRGHHMDPDAIVVSNGVSSPDAAASRCCMRCACATKRSRFGIHSRLRVFVNPRRTHAVVSTPVATRAGPRSAYS